MILSISVHVSFLFARDLIPIAWHNVWNTNIVLFYNLSCSGVLIICNGDCIRHHNKSKRWLNFTWTNTWRDLKSLRTSLLVVIRNLGVWPKSASQISEKVNMGRPRPLETCLVTWPDSRAVCETAICLWSSQLTDSMTGWKQPVWPK